MTNLLFFAVENKVDTLLASIEHLFDSKQRSRFRLYVQ